MAEATVSAKAQPVTWPNPNQIKPRSLKRFQKIAAYLQRRQARELARKDREIDAAWRQHKLSMLFSSDIARLRAERQAQLVKKFAEQDGLCFYCGEECWLPTDEDYVASNSEKRAERERRYKMATREHLKMKSRSGGDEDENIKMSCAYCNHNRQDAPVEEHKEAMLQRVAARRRTPENIGCNP